MINLKLFENFHTKGQLKKMYINYLISTNQVRKKQSGDGYILNSGTSVVVKNKFNEQPSQEFIIDYLIKFFKKLFFFSIYRYAHFSARHRFF